MYIQKVKGFFVKGYLEEEISKGDAGLCWNYGRIQSIFDKKAQSSTATDLAVDRDCSLVESFLTDFHLWCQV